MIVVSTPEVRKDGRTGGKTDPTLKGLPGKGCVPGVSGGGRGTSYS